MRGALFISLLLLSGCNEVYRGNCVGDSFLAWATLRQHGIDSVFSDQAGHWQAKGSNGKYYRVDGKNVVECEPWGHEYYEYTIWEAIVHTMHHNPADEIVVKTDGYVGLMGDPGKDPCACGDEEGPTVGLGCPCPKTIIPVVQKRPDGTVIYDYIDGQKYLWKNEGGEE